MGGSFLAAPLPALLPAQPYNSATHLSPAALCAVRSRSSPSCAAGRYRTRRILQCTALREAPTTLTKLGRGGGGCGGKRRRLPPRNDCRRRGGGGVAGGGDWPTCLTPRWQQLSEARWGGVSTPLGKREQSRGRAPYDVSGAQWGHSRRLSARRGETRSCSQPRDAPTGWGGGGRGGDSPAHLALKKTLAVHDDDADGGRRGRTPTHPPTSCRGRLLGAQSLPTTTRASRSSCGGWLAHHHRLPPPSD